MVSHASIGGTTAGTISRTSTTRSELLSPAAQSVELMAPRMLRLISASSLRILRALLTFVPIPLRSMLTLLSSTMRRSPPLARLLRPQAQTRSRLRLTKRKTEMTLSALSTPTRMEQHFMLASSVTQTQSSTLLHLLSTWTAPA